MVNVSDKGVTHRVAVACGQIFMRLKTLKDIEQGHHKKGDVLGIARIAGIMGAKKTSQLIPLCHPLSLAAADITFVTNQDPPSVECTCRVEIHARSGVEMEALTGTLISLVTIYDMCKSVDREMTISNVRLLEKSGGKSGHWRATT